MKEIGILFQGDMVRAILEDRKTLTSRLRGLSVINKNPDLWTCEPLRAPWIFEYCQGASLMTVKCPYGQPGDVLIGREACWIAPPNFGDPIDTNCTDYEGRKRYVGYSASMDGDSVRCAKDYGVKQTSSLLMPFWASRLRLEVVKVWPSRLQDMTEEMAIKEGIDAPRCPRCGYTRFDCQFHMDHYLCPHVTPRSAIPVYAKLWDRINGKTHPWASNPWVWRIEFRKINL